jgi:serine/threonine-protein phosphatase 4 regulatory subunit 1
MYASSSSTVTVSVQAFTPILGTLLLNENRRVGILARDALVGFLTKMNKVDEKLLGFKKSRRRRIVQPWEAPEGEDDEPLPYVGLFGNRERALFRQEILQQIVLGLGQLDDDSEVHHQQHHDESHHHPQQPQPSDWSNPYFPPVSTARPAAASITDSHATRSSPILLYLTKELPYP